MRTPYTDDFVIFRKYGVIAPLLRSREQNTQRHQVVEQIIYDDDDDDVHRPIWDY